MKKIIFLFCVFIFGCESGIVTETTVEDCSLCAKVNCENEYNLCVDDMLCNRFNSCMVETDKTCNECVQDPDIQSAKSMWSNLGSCLNSNCSKECFLNKDDLCD